MKKRYKALPIIISFILAFSIIAVAWVIQNAKITGIRVKTSGGIPIKIKLATGDTATDTINLNKDLTLKPSVYDGNAWTDEAGTVVSNNTEYIYKFSLYATSTEPCDLVATKTVTGDLPLKVVCGGTDIESGTSLGKCNYSMNPTFYVYVDGESYKGGSEGTVEIELSGVK